MPQLSQLVARARFIHRIYPAHVHVACFVTFLNIGLVQAQQPLAELGGWPAGAFTLLGGAWLCIRCLSESKYDVLPTILFARFLHKIPFLREILRSDEQFGGLTKEVVLTPIEYSKNHVIQEWDVLIVISKPVDVRFHSDSFVFRQTETTKADNSHRGSQDDTEAGLTEELNGDAEEGNAFEIEVITGVDMVKFDRVAGQLSGWLDLARGQDIPRVSEILRLWRALQIYQQYRQQTRWDPPLDRETGTLHGHVAINKGVESYLQVMRAYTDQVGSAKPNPGIGDPPPLLRSTMPIHYPDAPYKANELPVGATAEEKAVSAHKIAILLAFTEYVCGDRYRAMNPLILCIWLWMKGILHPSDNILITLPPSAQFIYPQPELPPIVSLPEPQKQMRQSPAIELPEVKAPADVTTQPIAELPPEIKSPSEVTMQPTGESSPPVELAPPTASEQLPVQSRAPNVLDLSTGDWEVDGGTFMNVWKVLWVLSLVSSALVAFFVILSGGGNPNFATTLGLLFARPYSIDSNPHDSGYPPSWNGRRQLRWGSGYSCGVFKGKFYKRMGPTGNSLLRATIVHAVSWATWVWRKQLQTSLNFTQSKPSSTWVLWVAVVFECVAMTASFSGIFMLVNWHQTKAAIACLLNFVSVSVVCALMFRYLIWNEGHGTLFWYSEMGLGTAILYPAVIHRGVGPSHGPFVWYNAMVWIHTIASSCFSR